MSCLMKSCIKMGFKWPNTKHDCTKAQKEAHITHLSKTPMIKSDLWSDWSHTKYLSNVVRDF